MNYSVFISKASRKPVHLADYSCLEEAIESGDGLIKEYKVLQKISLAVPGVCIQIIDSADLEKALKVEIGGFHEKINEVKVLYQIGSI